MHPQMAAATQPDRLELDLVRLELGDCLLRLKRFDEALLCFESCSSIGVRRGALFGRAVALQSLGRLEEAEDAYERLLSLDPQAEEALANLIAINVELFRLARIEELSQRLLEVNPGSAAARKGLALVHIERREFTPAARCLRQLPKDTTETPAGASAEGIRYRLRGKSIHSLELAWEGLRE